jgi:intracellular multiplication protein IcmO
MQGVRTTDEGRHRPPDTRGVLQRLADWLTNPINVATALVCSALIPIAAPAAAWLSLPGIAIILALHLPRVEPMRLVLRMPQVEGAPDLSDPKPGRKTFHKARGILYLGNDVERGNCQIWMSGDDACTHMLMLGTTGAGKTYNFISLVINLLSCGSGATMSDAKGDPKLAWEWLTALNRFGREDDFLVVSMLTVGRDPTTRSTNRMNPFARVNADGIVQLLSALAPDGDGPNAIFVKMGIVLVRSVANILVYLRDHFGEPLSVQKFRESLTLDALDRFWDDPRVPDSIKRTLRGFANDINFKPASERKGQPHGDSTLEQFQYAVMNFTDALSSLADTYGHVFKGSLADVDPEDVTRQRRCLLIMLPALEKSKEELKSTGRLIISNIRDAVARRLGSGIEGTREDILESSSAAATVPYLIASDEHGQIAVPGIGTVMAQARSLRIFVLIGSQGWTKLYSGNEAEATEIWDNARMKIAGSLEDPDGFDRFAKQAGQTLVTEAPGMEMPSGSWLGGYRRDRNVGVSLRDRLSFTDLQTQIEGEGTCLVRGSLIRVQLFGPDLRGKLGVLHVNRFLAVGEHTERAPEFGDLVVMPTQTVAPKPVIVADPDPPPVPAGAATSDSGPPAPPMGMPPAPAPRVAGFAPRSFPSVVPASAELRAPEPAAGSTARSLGAIRSDGQLGGIAPIPSTFDIERQIERLNTQDVPDDEFDDFGDGGDSGHTAAHFARIDAFVGLDATNLTDLEDEQMCVSLTDQLEMDAGMTDASLIIALESVPPPSEIPDESVVLELILGAATALARTAPH